MKTKLLVGMLALPFFASAQFSENFDAGTTAPAGWTVINGGDINTFTFGPGAAGTALSQPNAAQINYSAEAHDDYLVTPSITVTAGVNDRLHYYVKNQDPKYVEAYEVKVASANTAAAFAAGTVVTASANAPSAWTHFKIDLSSYVGQTIYVGFHATSTDMFRLLFDNIVNDTAPTAAPGCASLSAPANGATNLDFASLTLNWSASTTGGAVEGYDLYLDTNPNPTTLKGTYVNPTAPITNLLPSTTYYWKVVPKNAAGNADCSEIFSFKTKVDPFAPYCSGNLLYSSGVEAITSVSLADMTNTSPTPSTVPHEAFMDKVATLEKGKTYPIVFQGNTGGNFTNKFIVFVDWNQDGDFLDADETYFGGTSGAVTLLNSTGADGKTATGNISVPATATLGNTRMRIKKNFGTTSYPNPCYSTGTLATGATGGYGQAEDYTIKVTESVLAVADTNKSQLSVYPNPVKDVLNIASAEAKVTDVSFYSVDGRLVKQVSKNIQNVDVKALKPGIYVVKVKTSTTEKTFKVVKE